jgi:hypothetical protein
MDKMNKKVLLTLTTPEDKYTNLSWNILEGISLESAIESGQVWIKAALEQFNKKHKYFK